MENELVGRGPEQAILKKALTSKEAELVAVVGRRRIGKTYLVRSVYAPLPKPKNRFSYTLSPLSALKTTTTALVWWMDGLI